ncbi:MAG: hypothetical protein Q9188_001187 [Gyalolechia gomerana]
MTARVETLSTWFGEYKTGVKRRVGNRNRRGGKGQPGKRPGPRKKPGEDRKRKYGVGNDTPEPDIPQPVTPEPGTPVLARSEPDTPEPDSPKNHPPETDTPASDPPESRTLVNDTSESTMDQGGVQGGSDQKDRDQKRRGQEHSKISIKETITIGAATSKTVIPEKLDSRTQTKKVIIKELIGCKVAICKALEASSSMQSDHSARDYGYPCDQQHSATHNAAGHPLTPNKRNENIHEETSLPTSQTPTVLTPASLVNPRSPFTFTRQTTRVHPDENLLPTPQKSIDQIKTPVQEQDRQSKVSPYERSLSVRNTSAELRILDASSLLGLLAKPLRLTAIRITEESLRHTLLQTPDISKAPRKKQQLVTEVIQSLFDPSSYWNLHKSIYSVVSKTGLRITARVDRAKKTQYEADNDAVQRPSARKTPKCLPEYVNQWRKALHLSRLTASVSLTSMSKMSDELQSYVYWCGLVRVWVTSRDDYRPEEGDGVPDDINSDSSISTEHFRDHETQIPKEEEVVLKEFFLSAPPQREGDLRLSNDSPTMTSPIALGSRTLSAILSIVTKNHPSLQDIFKPIYRAFLEPIRSGQQLRYQDLGTFMHLSTEADLIKVCITPPDGFRGILASGGPRIQSQAFQAAVTDDRDKSATASAAAKENDVMVSDNEVLDVRELPKREACNDEVEEYRPSSDRGRRKRTAVAAEDNGKE